MGVDKRIEGELADSGAVGVIVSGLGNDVSYTAGTRSVDTVTVAVGLAVMARRRRLGRLGRKDRLLSPGPPDEDAR